MSEADTEHGAGKSDSSDENEQKKRYASDALLMGCGIEILLWLMFFPLIHFGISGSWVSLVIAVILGLLYFGLRWKGPRRPRRESHSDA